MIYYFKAKELHHAIPSPNNMQWLPVPNEGIPHFNTSIPLA